MIENAHILMESNLPDIPLIYRGKVRDIYDLDKYLLLVATDRISAFDVIMSSPIPDKGKILNQVSIYWFRRFEKYVKNHLVSHRVSDFPKVCHKYRDQLADRSMLVYKTKPVPIECIVRGYLVGSGWQEYKRCQEVCGINLAKGLLEGQKLDEPVFTPTTKASQGLHDENITYNQMVEMIGEDIAKKVRSLSLLLYEKGAEEAHKKGIIIADTKFEFGLKDGELLLIDEVLTPDSSRFWPASEYKLGSIPRSFDKQYLRDYLTKIGWDHTPPAPDLPEEVIDNTRKRYIEALKRLIELGIEDES